jgi:dihydrofolate reductase
MRLTLTTFLTLDGVMQAPGAPEEDQRGGFPHGGWQFPYADEILNRTGDWFASADAFLLGRTTYEIFASYWPTVTDPDNPVASRLNALPKYVATTTLDTVHWHNSTIINGDILSEIATLKAKPGNELQVHGSGRLAQTLMAHDLIDEYRLLIYPVVLGTGRRLFETPQSAALRLVDATTGSSGVILARYEPAGKPTYGSFAADEG